LLFNSLNLPLRPSLSLSIIPFVRYVLNAQTNTPINSPVKPSKKNNLYFKKISTIFLKLNFSSIGPNKSSTQRYRSFLLRHAGGGSSYISIKKSFFLYNSVFNLINELIRNNIPLIYFSGPVLRLNTELISLKLNNFIKNSLRLVYKIIFSNRNSMASSLSIAVTYLSRVNVNVVLISDSFYHRKTISHLKKAKIYSIGLASHTTYVGSLDYCVPIGPHNLANEVFFFKTFLSICRKSSLDNSNYLMQLWCHTLKQLPHTLL